MSGSSFMQRCVAQMSARKGIKKFGERGLATIVKEFTQLNEGAVPSQNRPVVVRINLNDLTLNESKAAHVVTVASN